MHGLGFWKGGRGELAPDCGNTCSEVGPLEERAFGVLCPNSSIENNCKWLNNL